MSLFLGKPNKRKYFSDSFSFEFKECVQNGINKHSLSQNIQIRTSFKGTLSESNIERSKLDLDMM